MPLSLKVQLLNEKMKYKATRVGIMHFKITTCTKNPQGFQDLGVIHGDSGLKNM